MQRARVLMLVAGLVTACGNGTASPPETLDSSGGSVADSAESAVANEAETSTDSEPEIAQDVFVDAPSSTDGSASPFTDPNPLPCVGRDPSAICLVGWPDTSQTFTGCCLTSF